MKKLLMITAAAVFSSTGISSLTTNFFNQNFSSNNVLKMNVSSQSFMIGSSLKNYYYEEFDLTSQTGIHGWSDFSSKYHYFAWAGDNSQGNNWYYAALVLQCQRDGVRNSTLSLSNIPNAQGIPLNNSTFMEQRLYDENPNGTYFETNRDDFTPISLNQLYYGGYYYNDSSSGDLIFGVSVNVQEQGSPTAKFTFNVGQYASFWS